MIFNREWTPMDANRKSMKGRWLRWSGRSAHAVRGRDTLVSWRLFGVAQRARRARSTSEMVVTLAVEALRSFPRVGRVVPNAPVGDCSLSNGESRATSFRRVRDNAPYLGGLRRAEALLGNGERASIEHSCSEASREREPHISNQRARSARSTSEVLA